VLLAFMVISLVFMAVTTWAAPGNHFPKPLPAAGRVEVSSTDAGQVIIFPYFDLERDVDCLVYNIVNVTDYWVEGTLRFRDGKKSVDILDFSIILSPHDVFLFMAVGSGYFGKPGFYSADPNTLAYSHAFLKNVADYTPGAVFHTVPEGGDLSDPTVLKEAGIPFKIDRLVSLGFTEDEANELIKNGYIEFIVKGMIENKWMDYDLDGKPDYPSLLQAAIHDSMDVNLNGVADWIPGTGPQNVAHCFYPGFPIPGLFIDGNQACAPVNPVFGIVHYYDVNTFTGYGQNAFQLANWRTPPDQNYPCHWTDLGYQPAGAVNVISGVTNGLILHEDNLFNIGGENNPFNRPDWATPQGVTIAFGDDLDKDGRNNVEDVWGSVDEIEQALYNIMDPWVGGLFFSATVGDIDTMTRAVLTFPTKYFHYNLPLLYCHDGRATWASLLNFPLRRTSSSDYNINVAGGLHWFFNPYPPQPGTAPPSVLTKATRSQDIDVSWMKIFDTFENPITGVSPIIPEPLPKEAGMYDIGPGAEYFDTGNIGIGWWALNEFTLAGGDVYADDNSTDEVWPIGFISFDTVSGGYITGRMTTDLVRFAEDPFVCGGGGGGGTPPPPPPPPPGTPPCWPWCGGVTP